MREEYISVSKNVDKAIEEGLKVIGKTREDVDIKILETGGLFKKAKVSLIYEKTEEIEDEKIAQETKNLENVNSQDENCDIKLESTPVTEEKTQEVEEEIQQVEDNHEIETENNENLSTKQEKIANIVDCSNLKARVDEYLRKLLELSNIQASVVSEIKDNEIDYSIHGENVGKLIGYRGETLNSIQYLLNNLKESGEGKIRIYLDVEGYKEKREQTLIDLANKMADKAEEIERNVHLDPMNAYERRIIHTTLQDRTLVETESTGEGNKRHVVIKFKR